jgi:hypothetical protein
MWLASITDSVVEAVVGALAAAALAALAFLFRSRRRKTKAVIELPLSNMLAGTGDSNSAFAMSEMGQIKQQTGAHS